MTISAHYNPPTYDGNGTTTRFPTVFPFRAGIDLLVTEIAEDGTETVLRMFRDYTTEGGGYENGTVVAIDAPAADVQWRIERRTPNFIDYAPTEQPDPDPAPEAVYIAVGNDNIAVVLRSTDGETWVDATPTLSPDAFSWGFNCVANDATAWVVGGFGPGTTDGLLRSTDGGLTWDEVSLPAALNTSINSIVSPSDGVFVCCDRTQIFRSTDSGATWSQITHGMSFGSGQRIGNLACNRDGVIMCAMVFASLEGYGISEDDGLTWTETSTGTGVAVANYISYANNNWILSLATGGIEYTAIQAPASGDWATKNYSGSTATEDFAWDGTRYWAIGSLGQMKTTSLATEPTYADVADRASAFGVMVVGTTTYFCTDFPSIETTTGGSLPLTAQTVPTLDDVYEIWEMGYRNVA